MAAESEPGGGSFPVCGVAIAVVSSFINGSTFVLQKKGILRARDRGVSYLTDVFWWIGTLSMIVGQIGNFLAYNVAPAVIVTPLGALGVLFGAVLASWILGEHLNLAGQLGCVLCCCGSVVLIIHAPQDEAVATRMDFEARLSDPVLVAYGVLVVLVLLVLVLLVVPAHGSSNMLVYVSICSLLGSFTVPSSKGLGLVAPDVFGSAAPGGGGALPLFLALLATLAFSVLVQFFFITKALQSFSSNAFEAVYYVAFTCSATLASTLLFGEWVELTAAAGAAVLGGLAAVCGGVVLLRMSQEACVTGRKTKSE
ncbi:magnesium transporter NIPA1 [Pseudoliparis swirei]|uniref:magnesium transporter NIPA1 n=1 Tax=Pseudoliparis swirei TaxID=2059687 RepID=UPI0024BE59D5|nr:magnesium transporter NIPA1 [Pseudoliparis swirei]